MMYFSKNNIFKATALLENLSKSYLKDLGFFFLKKKKDMAILNTYAPNTGIPNFIKQILLNEKSQVNSNTAIVGGFNVHSYH